MCLLQVLRESSPAFQPLTTNITRNFHKGSWFWHRIGIIMDQNWSPMLQELAEATKGGPKQKHINNQNQPWSVWDKEVAL